MKEKLQERFIKMEHYRVILIIFLLAFSFTKVNAQATESTAKKADVTAQPLIATNNVIRLSPIAALDIGFGFGLGYERYFGANKKFGLVLPLYFVLENINGGDNPVNGETKAYNSYFYFMPGFKYYPTGHKRLTYAFGPGLMFGFGNNKTSQWTYDVYGNSTLATVKYARKRFGVLMNNYVTYNVGKSFDIGLEGGLGFCYFDKESYNGNEFYPNSNERKGFDLAGQFSLSIGYKF